MLVEAPQDVVEHCDATQRHAPVFDRNGCTAAGALSPNGWNRARDIASCDYRPTYPASGWRETWNYKDPSAAGGSAGHRGTVWTPFTHTPSFFFRSTKGKEGCNSKSCANCGISAIGCGPPGDSGCGSVCGNHVDNIDRLWMDSGPADSSTGHPPFGRCCSTGLHELCTVGLVETRSQRLCRRSPNYIFEITQLWTTAVENFPTGQVTSRPQKREAPLPEVPPFPTGEPSPTPARVSSLFA